jgi:DNA transformation protein
VALTGNPLEPETTMDFFEKRGLAPFEYDKAGRIVRMSYYLAPEETFDSQDDAIL